MRIPERKLTLKCGNIFFENSQILKSFNLNHGSPKSPKLIMTARLLNNKRGKTYLICGENYIYSTLETNREAISTGDVLNLLKNIRNTQRTRKY